MPSTSKLKVYFVFSMLLTLNPIVYIRKGCCAPTMGQYDARFTKALGIMERYTEKSGMWPPTQELPGQGELGRKASQGSQ